MLSSQLGSKPPYICSTKDLSISAQTGSLWITAARYYNTLSNNMGNSSSYNLCWNSFKRQHNQHLKPSLLGVTVHHYSIRFYPKLRLTDYASLLSLSQGYLAYLDFSSSLTNFHNKHCCSSKTCIF